MRNALRTLLAAAVFIGGVTGGATIFAGARPAAALAEAPVTTLEPIAIAGCRGRI